MQDEHTIEAATERAAVLENEASKNGSKYPGLSYEAGLRDALDWVTQNTTPDPTILD